MKRSSRIKSKAISQRSHRSGVTAAILMASVICPAGARAQQALTSNDVAATKPNTENAIAEVVVTARRISENLQDVPVPVSAFTGDALVQKSIQDLTQLGTAVPGLFATQGGGRGSKVYAIRGQLNRDPVATTDGAVVFYFAEVPWARTQGADAAFMDLSSVQVLKGPQGTLFGRNSTGGAILLTPAAPTDQFDGHVKAVVGDYSRAEFEGVLNLPLTDDLALRIAAQDRQRKGYMTAVNTGRKVSDVDDTSLRASLRWDPGAFTSDLVVDYYHSSRNGDALKMIGVSSIALPSPLAALLRPSALAVLASPYGKYEFITSLAPGIPAAAPGGTQGNVQPAPYHRQYLKVETVSVQNTSSFDLGSAGIFGDLTFKNIAGYRQVKYKSIFEAVPIPLLNVSVFNYMDMEQISEEAQIIGNAGPLNYIAGVFYFRESGVDGSEALFLSTNRTTNGGTVKNISYSGFAHADLDFSSLGMDGLSLTGGLRVTHDERNVTYLALAERSPTLTVCTITGVPVPRFDGSLCALPRQVKFNKATWDIGVNYKVADSLVYALWSRGYRTGAFSSSAASLAATIPTRPETVDNYEIGLKSDFRIGDALIRLNAAAFYDKYADIQKTLNVSNNGVITSLTVNAAKASIAGGELDLTVRPTSNLEMTFGFSHIRPKYQEFIDLVSSRGVLYPVDVSDSKFILTSKNTFTASLAYTIPIDERYGTPIFRASYYHRSSFYTSSDINTARCSSPADPNVPPAFYSFCLNREGKLPGYGVANLRLDWGDMLGSNVDVALFVDNFTNKYYFSGANMSYSNIGTSAAYVGAPRMFGVELRVPFGASAR